MGRFFRNQHGRNVQQCLVIFIGYLRMECVQQCPYGKNVQIGSVFFRRPVEMGRCVLVFIPMLCVCSLMLEVLNRYGCFCFPPSPLTVSRCTTMKEMFAHASSFSGHLSSWDGRNFSGSHWRIFGLWYPKAEEL